MRIGNSEYGSVEEFCQRLLDEQGFMVIGWYREFWLGEVIPGLSGNGGYPDLTHPVVVIGLATSEDYEQQRKSFGLTRSASGEGYTNFAKVAAE